MSQTLGTNVPNIVDIFLAMDFEGFPKEVNAIYGHLWVYLWSFYYKYLYFMGEKSNISKTLKSVILISFPSILQNRCLLVSFYTKIHENIGVCRRYLLNLQEKFIHL